MKKVLVLGIVFVLLFSSFTLAVEEEKGFLGKTVDFVLELLGFGKEDSLTTTSSSPETRDGMINDYIIDGDLVYFNDSSVYLSAFPHTFTGDFVELGLNSKVFTGDVTVALGFPNEQYSPSSLERWNPHTEQVYHEYTCDYDFNFTQNPNYFWCYANNGTGDVVLFEHAFDGGNISSQTAWWYEDVETNWSDFNIDSQIINFEVGGVNTWRVAQNLPIVQNQDYKVRVNFDAPDTPGIYEKYWFCIMPSSYGTNFQEANTNGQLYCLDPWLNTSNIGAYYDFDTNLSDSSTSGYDLTNVSGVYTASGKINGAWSFDGSNSYVKLTDGGTDKLDVGADNFTFAMWVYPDSLTATYIFGKKATPGYFIYQYSNGRLQLGARDSDSTGCYITASDPVIAAGEWSHIAMVRDATNGDMQLYRNGVLNLSVTSSDCSENIDNTADFNIATINNGATGFTGDIDEFLYSTEAYNASQIADLYNSDSGYNPFAPVAGDNASFFVNTVTLANNSNTTDQTPDFTFNVTGNRNFYDCDLFINSSGYGSNESVSNNTLTTITANASLAVGNYNFNFSCVNDSVSNISETRFFEVLSLPAGNCTCPGLNQNWNVNLADSCDITADCDLGTGKLSFTGSGFFTCNATITTSDLGDVGNGNFLYVDSGCLLNVN